MRLPTDTEIATLKGIHTDIELVQLDDHDFACVVRQPTQKEVWDYIDAAEAKSPDAAPAFALRCALWPARSEVYAAIKRAPFLAHRIVEALESKAGGDPARATYVLDDRTDPELLDALGIPREKVADIRSTYPFKGQLVIVHHDMGVVVLHAPTDGTAKLWKDAMQTKAKAQASFDFAVNCTAFPAEEAARALYERAAAMPYAVLLEKILDLGGAGAKAKRKKV